MRAKRNGNHRQTALVTGGSGGIGLELAKVLARNGFDLVLVSRTRDSLEAAAGQIEGKYDVRVHVFAADLRRREAPEAIFDFLHNENTAIDILINNAGFGLGGEFAETELRSEEHTSELQSHHDLVCRLLLENKKQSLYSIILTVFSRRFVSIIGVLLILHLFT